MATTKDQITTSQVKNILNEHNEGLIILTDDKDLAVYIKMEDTGSKLSAILSNILRKLTDAKERNNISGQTAVDT